VNLPALGLRADRQTQCTYLIACHRIAHQCQVHELLEARERVQVGELSDAVFGKDKRLQIRYAGREVRLDIRNAVLREEQCPEAGLQREVAKLRNVVVGEVNRVVVLRAPSVDSRRVDMYRLTRAAPMFSIAEILWPRIYRH
jgi:hypothetical protein